MCELTTNAHDTTNSARNPVGADFWVDRVFLFTLLWHRIPLKGEHQPD